MDAAKKIFKLKGKVQHYAWGGDAYIPALLNINNTNHQPFAEYWLGAHPSASAVTDNGESLQQLIQQNPQLWLTENAYNSFGELPYLLKVLDVKDMLSIQVHPSKTEAAKGFDAEEAAGIPINAPHRNYKDRNHKPEVMIALSDEFWLLHGFKNRDLLEKTLEDVSELSILQAIFKREGYQSLYRMVMEMPQQEVDTMLAPLVKKELRRKEQGLLTKEQPGWWVAKLYEGQENPVLTDIDKGVFSIYFFNIVKVLKGEAVFQAAGIPHAYLEGQNVELMANSDNVLRGGLTPKHIDVPELMKHTLFEGITPNVMKGVQQGHEKKFLCPVPDFSISMITLAEGEKYGSISHSLEILLVTEGAVIAGKEENLLVKKGEAFAVMPGKEYVITASGKAEVFKAFIPV